MSQDLKKQLETERSQVIKDKGFDSSEYFQKLKEDADSVSEAQGDAFQEVFDKLKIAQWVVENSQDEYIGISSKVDDKYVHNFLETFLYHPYKNSVKKEVEDALVIALDVVEKACARIENPDTDGSFESPEDLMICFNQLCLDYAREGHNLSEADYLYMVDDHGLYTSAKMIPFFKRIAQRTERADMKGEESEEEDTEEIARQAEARKLEREQTIKQMLTQKKLESENKPAEGGEEQKQAKDDAKA